MDYTVLKLAWNMVVVLSRTTLLFTYMQFILICVYFDINYASHVFSYINSLYYSSVH